MHFNLGTGVFVSGLLETATGDAAASSSSSPLSFMFCCVFVFRASVLLVIACVCRFADLRVTF